MRRDKKKGYKETTFFGMLQINGPKLIFNYTFLISLVAIFLVHSIYSGFELSNFTIYTETMAKDFYNRISSMSASIFGIVIAAMAVSMTIFNKKVLIPLERTKLLHKFLFPFWYMIVLWGIVILLSTFLPYVYSSNIYNEEFLAYILIFTMWLFLYALFFAIKITGVLIRLFIQNAKII